MYEIKDDKPSLVNFDFANGIYTVSKHIERGYLAIGKIRMDFEELPGNQTAHQVVTPK